MEIQGTVKIKVGEKEIELTVTEAKQLKNMLKNMFEDVVFNPLIPRHPINTPYYGTPLNPQNGFEIYCSTNTGETK
jgi:hypothetical protein